MSTQELIIKEVENLPEPLQREVYDFARFLREKADGESFNGLLLSESAPVEASQKSSPLQFHFDYL